MKKKIVKVSEYQRVKKGKVEDVSKHRRHVDVPEVSKKDVKNVKSGKSLQLNLSGYFVEVGNFRVKPTITSSKGNLLNYFCSTYDRELAKSKVKAMKSGNVDSKWVIGGISGKSVFRIYSNQKVDVSGLNKKTFEEKKVKQKVEKQTKKEKTKLSKLEKDELKINVLEDEIHRTKKEIVELDLNRQDYVDKVKAQWYEMMINSKDQGSKSLYTSYITRDINRYDAKMKRLRKKVENDNVKILKVKLNYDKITNIMKSEFGASGESKWVPSKKVKGAGKYSDGYVIVGPNTDLRKVALTYRVGKGKDEFKASQDFKEKVTKRLEAESVPYEDKGEAIVIG